jgi:hypothetical protein
MTAATPEGERKRAEAYFNAMHALSYQLVRDGKMDAHEAQAMRQREYNALLMARRDFATPEELRRYLEVDERARKFSFAVHLIIWTLLLGGIAWLVIARH